MKTIGIIPARYASTRFPGKPLALIHGKTMIRRVYERASQAGSLSEVVVATDDQRIFDHVTAFGGKAVMTQTTHASGTDRCAEVLAQWEHEVDVVVNIQGDEPYIQPQQIDLLVSCFETTEAKIGTLVKRITSPEDLQNHHIPKVVLNNSGYALYFSRHPVPYCKEEEKMQRIKQGSFFKHIGIYGYRADVLPLLSALPTGLLESCESLEQLRWLENGFNIITRVTEHDNIAVDTPEDVATVEKRFAVTD